MTEFKLARAWFDQAESDARTGEALLVCARPMQVEDVGFHVAVMCAQSVEKSLKGYMHFNRTRPAMNHRPDKYLRLLLDDSGKLLRFPGHHRSLSRLFNRATKARLRGLLDLTPGGRGNRSDVPNTEYPWHDSEGIQIPVGHPVFADRQTAAQWVRVAKQITRGLRGLVISAELVSL